MKICRNIQEQVICKAYGVVIRQVQADVRWLAKTELTINLYDLHGGNVYDLQEFILDHIQSQRISRRGVR